MNNNNSMNDITKPYNPANGRFIILSIILVLVVGAWIFYGMHQKDFDELIHDIRTVFEEEFTDYDGGGSSYYDETTTQYADYSNPISISSIDEYIALTNETVDLKTFDIDLSTNFLGKTYKAGDYTITASCSHFTDECERYYLYIGDVTADIPYYELNYNHIYYYGNKIILMEDSSDGLGTRIYVHYMENGVSKDIISYALTKTRNGRVIRPVLTDNKILFFEGYEENPEVYYNSSFVYLNYIDLTESAPYAHYVTYLKIEG